MIEYAYILAASHSGSTLLTRLLARHRMVATVGETASVQSRGNGEVGLCSCSRPLEQCSFWTRIFADLKRRGHTLDADRPQVTFRLLESPLADRLLRAEYRGRMFELLRDLLLALHPRWRRNGKAILALNEALIDVVMNVTGAHVFVDSSKEPHRLKFLLRSRLINPRIIHLVRDGRGVTASYRRKNLPLDRAVDEWRRSIRSEECLLRNFSRERVFFLRYEDMCADVEGNLRRIWAFLGLDSLSESLRDPPPDLHILGNRMRLDASLAVRVDERWRKALSPTELEYFEAQAGAINRRYDYS